MEDINTCIVIVISVCASCKWSVSVVWWNMALTICFAWFSVHVLIIATLLLFSVFIVMQSCSNLSLAPHYELSSWWWWWWSHSIFSYGVILLSCKEYVVIFGFLYCLADGKQSNIFLANSGFLLIVFEHFLRALRLYVHSQITTAHWGCHEEVIGRMKKLSACAAWKKSMLANSVHWYYRWLYNGFSYVLSDDWQLSFCSNV